MYDLITPNMWRTLKADIKYHGIVIGIVFTIALILLIGDVLFESFDIYMMMGFTTLSFYASMWIIGATDDNEKRDRYQVLLPLSVKGQSFVRLILFILFQVGITLLWSLLFLIQYIGENNTLLWDILSFNGLNITIIMLFVIFSDLGHVGSKAHRWIFLASVLTVFFLLIYLNVMEVLNHPLSFGPEIRKTPIEALLCNIVCIGLIYYDHGIYQKRKSYLD